MTRPSEDQTNLDIARVAAKRTTCARRAVGCVLTDAHGYVISVGRNGVEAGREHCNEGYPCPAHAAPSGTQLSGCEAIHAEINAIAHCSNPREVHTIYVTVSPCGDCMKALLALPNAQRLVYGELYTRHLPALDKWKRAGRSHELLSVNDVVEKPTSAFTLPTAPPMNVEMIAIDINRHYRLPPDRCISVAKDLYDLFYVYPRTTRCT